MAKKKINYQNTVIYKISCDDTEDFYIGSTTDFTSRKSSHKTACTNEKHKSYNFKVYKTIREYSGWQNWRMVVVEKFPCDNRRERCSVYGCKNYPVKDGVCVSHGAVVKRCSIDGCENGAVKDGICVSHGAVTKRCSIEGCENKSVKGGVCAKHSPRYTCTVCNKSLSIVSQKAHEKTKTHLENV